MQANKYYPVNSCVCCMQSRSCQSWLRNIVRRLGKNVRGNLVVAAARRDTLQSGQAEKWLVVPRQYVSTVQHRQLQCYIHAHRGALCTMLYISGQALRGDQL